MALFRVDYSGRGELSERQQKVGTYLFMATMIYKTKKIDSLHRYLLPPQINSQTDFTSGQMLSKLTKLSEEYNV